jgi:tetratricopeptide (TPR) repeat protein
VSLAVVLTVLLIAPSQGLAEAQEPVRPGPEPSLAEPVSSVDGLPVPAERRAAIAESLAARAYDRAEALLLEDVESNPRSPELLRTLGGVFFLRGNYLSAAVAMKKAEALAPLDERSRFTLAMSYVVLRRLQWARDELDRLSKAAPRNPLYVYWSARLHYDEQHYAAAVDGFVRVIALDPRFMKAHDNLGLCYDALGRHEDAVRSHREAVRLNGELPTPSPWPPMNLGALLVRLGRLEEAEPLLRASLRIDPRFAPGHFELGIALEKTARTEDAVRELEEAARLDASYPEPRYALARLYRRRGDAERADATLAEFRRLKKEKEEGQAGPGPR